MNKEDIEEQVTDILEEVKAVQQNDKDIDSLVEMYGSEYETAYSSIAQEINSAQLGERERNKRMKNLERDAQERAIRIVLQFAMSEIKSLKSLVDETSEMLKREQEKRREAQEHLRKALSKKSMFKKIR